MEELLKTFMSQMNHQFSLLTKEIHEIKDGVASLEGRMDKLEGKVDTLEGRIDKLEGRITALEENQSKLIKNQNELKQTINQHATEFRSHFKKIEEELKQHREAFNIYAADLSSVKTNVEYLSGKTGVHDMKINNIEKSSKYNLLFPLPLFFISCFKIKLLQSSLKKIRFLHFQKNYWYNKGEIKQLYEQ
ncbi:hypothetical protein [Metabacillus sp. Hm71]|uniref:hypothetical protein n=1 Tax=Metabacillus sp. Hm71 TaxID=3450743 RepID=UPI003F438078